MAIVLSLIPVLLLIAVYAYAGSEPSHASEVVIYYVAPVVSALTTALIIFFIDRKFKGRDAKDEQIAELLAEREKEKEEVIKEWRVNYSTTLCGVKKTVDEIKNEMHQRVHITDCHDREREIDSLLSKHDERLRAMGG